MERNDLIKEFVARGLHLGGRRSFIHPKMKKFVFTFKNDLALIDLEKAAELWEKTFEELKNLILQGKTILFVGTQPAAGPVLKKYGEELNLPYITGRWLGGTITNFQTLKKRLDYLAELEAKLNSQEVDTYTKKERGLMKKESEEIRGKFEGLVKLKFLPDALFVFCGKKHRTALKEAQRKGVKIFGLLGLEDDPDQANQFIPLNDNTRIGIEFVMEQIKQIYQEQQKAAKKSSEEPKEKTIETDAGEKPTKTAE
ncbi:MAG: 30S ribosomal protein S2 [Patescibacteria group bacterium]